MKIKKRHIILVLIICCIIISLLLQFIEMNLTLRTILVTLLIAFLFSIRGVITLYEDKTDSPKGQ